MDPAALVAKINELAADPPTDVQMRQTIYDAARYLMMQTENRHELTHRVLFSQAVITVARVAADLNLFQILTAQSTKALRVSELAQQTGAEQQLLVRILRGLASNGLVRQVPSDAFQANEATKIFALDNIRQGIAHNFLTVGPCFQALPDYLKKTQYRNPADNLNGPFQFAHNTTLHPFHWFADHPENMTAMIGTMSGQRTGQTVWLAEEYLFPSSDFQLSEEDIASGRALMVDVGGGAGQQAICLRKAHPELRGRVVLQELQPTLDSIDDIGQQTLMYLNIELQGHDFFASQPEKGAKVYQMRNILHDWSDNKCCEILRNIKDAMKPDSVLIVDDIVVSAQNTSWKQFNCDIIMMACLAGEERTQKHFQSLFASAGLKLRSVQCYDEGSGDSFLIATPA